MFYTIHRAVKFLTLCALLFVAWRIYEARAIFEPALNWVDVWDNGGFHAPPVETVSGRVVQVVNSQTFVLKPKGKGRLNVRLMGLRDPSTEVNIDSREKEKIRREALEKLIMDQWVYIEMQYENANNIGGTVFCHGQNINAELVQRGLAVTSKDRVKGFPKETQYSMLWAQKHRTPIF